MVAYKISILGLVLFCSTLLLNAQVDIKYLTGAVPEVDGRVVFTREIKVNSSVSKSQLYDLTKQWMDETFQPTKNSEQRVLFADKEQDYIVAQGDEHLVFKDQMLSYDHTIFKYQLVARVSEGLCTLEMKNLRYDYQDYDKTMTAEQMLTDKVALHKNGDKLNRHFDKFRIKTIDRIDGLKNSLLSHLPEVSVVEIEKARPASIVDEQLLPQPTPSIKVESSPAVSIAQPTTAPTALSAMSGYKEMNAENISENIMNMFKDSWMLATVGTADKAKSLIAAWSGMGIFGSKPVSMSLVKSENSSDETYTISFYTQIHKDELDRVEKGQKSNLTPITTPSGASAYAEAWMIIECKKVLEQPATDAMINDAQSKKWNKNNFDKLYMGEIVKVWAR